ncbi:polynucleotide adenylyltransferase PcnB [Psychrobacter sp. TAE2020]|uniref:polynucleotide adenylyltransferase PcnB n=1 Tax=Psychrobacter sp. TAE2020 TaxID=2846762 RepID=UPI001C11E59F|nr:polynucleotide adenylyltransferase PcnB [Psychrobacter sp. TAE2020]MBU5616986.1 polynucleotide adenylyltransferase PcnB [Psychrobacter sp. TAE2020]
MAERAAKQLELNKSELPNSITEVIATLSRAGFDAYIVGGGVRDTLLGLRPKDFDAVTDAKPHEIKDVFGKRCRIIGRRFQLAHVYSGRELIEVATFRGPPNNDSNTNQDGMIIRDNVWGDIKQDFSRRDFSINALYYQPLKGVVHDFCGALDDIDNKIIRLLGNAPVRIEEDPVRLLRALRFKAKLGFEFDKELAEQFHDGNWALLEQISPHRLYDETQKMFTGGYLVPLLPLLFESGAIDSLIIYPPADPSPLVQQVAINTDKRIGAGKSINPAFFYAALLWENYLHQLEKAKKRNMPFAEAQMQAAGKVIDRQRIKTAIPKFAEQFIRDIWLLQPKLAAPRSKQIEQLAEHPRFRAGFDFLLLREQCGDAEHPLSESTNDMGDWWQTYQTLSESQKQQAIEDFDENIRRGAYKQAKNGPRGRGRNRQNQQDSSDNEQAQPSDINSQNNSSKKEQSMTNAQPPAINDASNVPSRRRRRTDNVSEVLVTAPQANASLQSPSPQSEPSKSRHSNRSANKLTPRQKHDSNELAQLQQLSLAYNSAESNTDQASSPAPLFVIEHDNVVPPLKKQLAEQTQKPNANINSRTDTSANDSNSVKQKAAVSKVKPKLQPKPEQKPNQKSAKPVATEEKAKRPLASVTETQVAQTPKLVSTNNEPIPYQRRRRQPSTVEAMPTVNGSATGYEKKLPKVVAPVDTESKANSKPKSKETTAKLAEGSKIGDQTKPSKVASEKQAKVSDKTASNSNVKGAVPSKRRRRQPSTDITVTEQEGK